MAAKDSKKTATQATRQEEPGPVHRIPPGLASRSALTEETRPDQKGSFGFRGGVIAFVDWEGKVYVTPGTRLKLELLEQAGFTKPKPPIEVPGSDGSVKSKRWLRKNLPPNEIHRSVEENQLPKVEPKVYAGIIQANLEGLRDLPREFLDRCVPVREKLYFYVGLCASYRGILSFTDWSTDTWITPFSERKRRILEDHGYSYVESMIRVPYSLESEENQLWLVKHIPPSEWELTEKEIEEERAEESMKKAQERIKKLGLKELPEDLLACSAKCEEEFPEYIGITGAHNGVLAFTDPLGQTFVTPVTRGKVDQLRSLGYQFMGSSIKIPHSLKTREDIEWLQSHIAREHWDTAAEVARAEQQHETLEQAEKRQRSLHLEDLPSTLLEHSIKTDAQQSGFVGQYFIRGEMLGFVDPTGAVFITPLTGKKISVLRQANYKEAHTGFRMPHSGGTQQDLDYIVRHLSQEELDQSRLEREEETRIAKERIREKVLKKVKLKPVPADLLSRCAKTDQLDVGQIGVCCSRGGVTCFIYEDGYYYITPTVPWKEETLRKAGYHQPDHLIRVPYGSNTREDQLWLQENLPAGELERSREENQTLEEKKSSAELKKRLQQIGIDEKLPEPIAARAAVTDMVNMEQVGHYMTQGSVITFVGPDGRVWVTPETPEKLEMLKSANYTHATRRIPAPHVTDLPEDLAWLEANLPAGEIERSRKEREKVESDKEEHLAHDIADRKGIKPLTEEFTGRCALAGKVASQHVGIYFHRDGMMFVVDSGRNLYVTPVTQAKHKYVIEKGYHQQDIAPPVPYASGSDKDTAWIQDNLPESEIDRSGEENEKLQKSRLDEKTVKNMEKYQLEPVPEAILKRSADSGSTEPENIGRLGVYRGVFAFVLPSERVMISWYTPQKQEALEECGYKMEGRLPIKVPYAMPDSAQRKWLVGHLPKPDQEEEISVEENAE